MGQAMIRNGTRWRGTIRVLLVISIDDNECSMTQVKGRVRPNDIERWTKWEK